MDFKTIARRTIFFLLTVIAMWIARGVWDYNPDLRARISAHPLQSFGLLAVIVISISMLVWGVVRPSSWKVLLAFGLGVAAAIWGIQLLKGIGWQQVGVLLVCIAGLTMLWAFTVLDSDHPKRVIGHARTRLRTTPARSDESVTA